MSSIKRKPDLPGAAKDVKRQRTENGHTPKTGEIREQRNGSNAAAQKDYKTESHSKVDYTSAPKNKLPYTAKKPYQQHRAGPKEFKLETSSAEAHAKQRALAQERKANKPNADIIQRSKKIWERLRLKSHVPLAERKELVAELFGIITGRMQDFVFKHDSVRVIQCAHKYANLEQRRQIATELSGGIRPLAESKYAKFLVAKLAMDPDEKVRGVITPEFFGHVKKLINHPEASWLVDDIYRQAATPAQKAVMLKEWYGPEFALFHKKGGVGDAGVVEHEGTSDLVKILEKNPEKRRPMLQHLLQMINGLIQKKMTGFTMLHDAMLQYFLALTPGSDEHIEFLEVLKGDIDPDTEGGGGDLFRNLSFTRSGSRLVCLALAYGSAKDRKMILRCFKDTVEMMAYDQYGKIVLVVALDVPDDTKMTGKSIVHELLGQGITEETQRLDRLEKLVKDINARVPILYPLAGMAKWLVNDTDKAILEEVHAIRTTTSKKDPEIRRQEIIAAMSAALFELVTSRAEQIVHSSFCCQFIPEVLLEAQGAEKTVAMEKVAATAAGDPATENHISRKPAAARMFKTLVMGGNFDPESGTVKLANPPPGFGAVLFDVIKDRLVEWACSGGSFVVVASLESEDVPADVKKEVRTLLKAGKKSIEASAAGHTGDGAVASTKAAKETKKNGITKGNVGAKILLEKLK